MKKLELNRNIFAGAEVLSKEQLKRVMGGTDTTGGEEGEGTCYTRCIGSGTLQCQNTPGCDVAWVHNYLATYCLEYCGGTE